MGSGKRVGHARRSGRRKEKKKTSEQPVLIQKSRQIRKIPRQTVEIR